MSGFAKIFAILATTCSAALSVVADVPQTTGARIRRVADAAEIGQPLPAWKPGELELHFIATGVGENAFYRLPDGTTWLNDCGDYWYDKTAVPPKPSGERLGAEWVVRYLERLGVKGPIDYLTVSHWHTDHVGDPKMRSVVTKDGRKVCGAALVAEHFGVRRYSDFEYPETNKYKSGDHSRLMMREYVELAVKERGLKAEPFRVGALDQFKLLHDPMGRYAKLFHVRNLCANGRAWTGRGEETRDFAGEQVELTKNSFVDANSVSMAVRIDYGPFRFYTGGDVSHGFRTKDGRIDYEAHVAKVAGPVTVAKTNHHGTPDTMGRAVAGELRAAAWVSCVWHKAQINDTNMRWMSSRELYPGDRFLFPTCIPQPSVEAAKDCVWWKDVVSPGHVVVKVAPGGETYRIYVLTCADESMRVESVFAGESAAVEPHVAVEPHADEVVREVLANVAKIRAADPQAVPMAFWDFDGTIIKGDVSEGLVENGEQRFAGLVERTVKAGLSSVYRGEEGWKKYVAEDYPRLCAIGRWLGWPFNAQIYGGVEAEELDRFCSAAFRETYAKWYFASSVRILTALERAGVRNYIVSASPEIFVRNAAETLRLPVGRFRGIRVAISGGRMTTRLVYPIPYGEGKVENVRDLVMSVPHGVAVAGFGNSYSTDAPFLRYIATQPSLPGGARGFALMINGGKTVPGYTEHFRCVRQDDTEAVQ